VALIRADDRNRHCDRVGVPAALIKAMLWRPSELIGELDRIARAFEAAFSHDASLGLYDPLSRH
jgi:hypothetical protein